MKAIAPYLISSPAINEILMRAQEQQGVSPYEATLLLSECSTASLVQAAGKIRDTTKPNGLVTYSRKVFFNLVNLCRDTCLYCTYKKEPSSPGLSLMTPEMALILAEKGRSRQCTEALIVTGERPEERYAEAKRWLHSQGHSNLVDYICEISEMILIKTGMLPHTNAGSLYKSELQALKETNVSIGVMLESSSERLMEKGMPHAGAPSKDPRVRLSTLRAAGELHITTTTGLLVGIGETPEELVQSISTLRELSLRYGHVQEIIMQNFTPKPRTGMYDFPAAQEDYFIRAVAIARIMLPDMNIQVPPNLSPNIYSTYLDAGINDWGGISPLTIDYVNPEFAWPPIEQIASVCQSKGRKLRPRLPVYPEYVKGGFISERLQTYVCLLSDGSGLVKEDYISHGN